MFTSQTLTNIASVLFGILAFVFFIAVLVACFNEDRSISPLKALKKRLILIHLFMFLFFITLLIAVMLLDFSKFETGIFCIFGSGIVVLISYVIAYLQAVLPIQLRKKQKQMERTAKEALKSQEQG